MTEIYGGVSNEKSKDWIQTFTGQKFFPLNPRIEDIKIEDIAHALSMLCRYGGHSSWFYSVAQHCVLVSYQIGGNNLLALTGLLHDASEAYLVDIPRPIKYSPLLEGYRTLELNLEKMIAEKFGTLFPFPQEIYDADIEVYASEARILMSPIHPDWDIPKYNSNLPIDRWSPMGAESIFLNRFKYLTKHLEE